jgi:hypothetical protein
MSRRNLADREIVRGVRNGWERQHGDQAADDRTELESAPFRNWQGHHSPSA